MSRTLSNNGPEAPPRRRADIFRRLTLGVAAALVFLVSALAAKADRNPPNCTGSGLGINLFVSAPDAHIGDTLFYSVTVFNGLNGTGQIACDASDITAFIVTPDGKTNAVPLVRTALSQGQQDTYPDVVSYVVRAQDIQPDGTLLATARDIGTIHQNIVNSIGGGFQGLNTVVQRPCVQISAVCTGSVGENGLITFTSTVKNCGNDELFGLVVTNHVNNGGFLVFGPTNLDVGQSATFSGSWLPANVCLPSTAVLTTTSTDQSTFTPQTVTNSATVTCQDTLTPGIVVTKACPAQPVPPGQLLTFSGSVSNTGNVTLLNIVVVDNQPAPNTQVYTLASLAPGASASFTGSYLAPTNCSVSDTLTANASTVCGVPVANSASVTCPILILPQIAVTANCPSTPIVSGGSFTYSGTVQNTGNITLTNVSVFSSVPAANTRVFSVATLAPGAIANFTSAATVPAGACSVTASFSGIAQNVCTLASITNTIATTCSIVTAPAVAVTLTCPATTAVAGGLITYSGTVRNTGNVALNNVFVVNNNPAPNTPVVGPLTLAPGASSAFTTSFTAPAGTCSVSTTVNASANDACSGAAVTAAASATCPLGTAPGLVVTETCPAGSTFPGSPLTYSGTVVNSGTVMLTNVVVVNNQTGSTPIFIAATLDAGQTASFSGSYTAPTNCTSTSTLTATGETICGIFVTNHASATCPVQLSPGVVVTANCPSTAVGAGGSFTYTGTVQNTGNIPLTNVVVYSDKPAVNTRVFSVATLAAGATANFTGTYTVPAGACAITTTLAGTAADVCSLNSITNTVAITCNITTAPAIAVTLSCPATTATVGGLITYTGTVRNSGNNTLNNVFVVNNQPVANTSVVGPLTLAPGQSSTFTASFTAPSDVCSVSSTVTASGNDNCSAAPVTASASATCSLVTAPGIVVTETCPAGSTTPGSLLTYSGTVFNSGNILLTNIVVVNNQSGTTPVFTVANLDIGQTVSFTGSYSAPTNCSSTSTSTATARSICGVGVTNRASATCPVLSSAAIVVTANCPTATVVPGGSVTYSGKVQNTGNVTLTNVVVVSSQPGANTTVYSVATLAPGVTASFTATYTVPAGACSLDTTFTANAKDACALAPVTSAVTTTCTVKTASAIAVTLTCPTGTTTAGALMTYSGTVRNSGNVTLNNVFVVNNQPGPGTAVVGPLTLAPGASSAFTASFTAPTDSCSVSSTVTATGNDNCTAATVTASASATCNVSSTPGIVVTETCPASPAVPGTLLVYNGTVFNSGNITLTNVVVKNNQSGTTPVFTAPSIAPGVTLNFTGSYLTPSGCASTSTSTATARSVCGVSVSSTSTATCPIFTAPAISVTQNCPATAPPPGGMLVYSGTVSNAGNITLTNIVVVINVPATNTVVYTVASLAPGVSKSFTCSYKVPTNCCVVWSELRGSGKGCSGELVTDEVTTTCNVLTSPKVTITRVCPTGILHTGDVLNYSGTISNAGNISLINVTVTDNQTLTGAPLLGPIDLTPGEMVRYYGSLVVPPDYCGNDVVSVTGQDVCSFTSITSTVSSTCVVATAPRIGVIKNCPSVPTPRGGLYTYTGTVTNMGDVTLVNVFVVDNQPSNNTPVIGPITLAPGASMDFSGSYIAPRCCCLIIDTLTARGKDRCWGSNVTAQAGSVCPLLSTPTIGLIQSCSPTPIPVGSVYSFSGIVTNAGDVVLTNVFVFSPLGAPLLGPIELAPGQTEAYAGSYTVPADTCAVVVTASGLDICGGNLATNATSCPVANTPLLVVTQDCPAGSVGGVFTFSGSVSNAGNVTLTKVVVNNDHTGGAPLVSIASLAPGASATFTGSYAVTSGSTTTSTSTGSGSTRCGVLVTDSVTATCPTLIKLQVGPSINVSATTNSLNLSFPTTTGTSYTIQYKNSPTDPTWTSLKTMVGNGGTMSVLDAIPAGRSMRIYRLVLAP